ncbi:hypothetical protein HJC23_012474 [Cyclotella cryptica]|uniref:Uncharacterized protein n=1 Tax=Cyclotella cryptica TaxID=29204 RepID=A0ABD3PAL4_9STRA|eukprot:CCRYP_016282-RA/>CCRYP_016282-RA protein AED:0.12 eAED:0.12 QI:0/-1/0/1/-1/1/1/0/234
MNTPKISPNIRTNNNTNKAVAQQQHVKRVSFQKAIEGSDENTATVELHSPGNLSSNPKLKPAMKTQIEETCDCVKHITKTSCPSNSFPPVSTSQHEMASSLPTLPTAPRRRVKSMPVGSSASRNFFGITGADSRCSSMKPLAMLHEDCVIGEGKHSDPVIETKEKVVDKAKTVIERDIQTRPNSVDMAASVTMKQPSKKGARLQQKIHLQLYHSLISNDPSMSTAILRNFLHRK